MSWIWDAPLESLADLAPMTLTGNRADDLALRFKYARPFQDHRLTTPLVDVDIERALESALHQVLPGGSLMVLGTYTTLLGIRAVLERRGLAIARTQDLQKRLCAGRRSRGNRLAGTRWDAMGTG